MQMVGNKKSTALPVGINNIRQSGDFKRVYRKILFSPIRKAKQKTNPAGRTMGVWLENIGNPLIGTAEVRYEVVEACGTN